MVKCVMIQLCRCLFGLSYLALYVLLCYQLFGWVATLIIVSVQLFTCRMADLGNDNEHPIKSNDLAVQQQIMATQLSGDYVSH
ncbi:MAG: hypothetical protein ACLUVG_04375 [Phocaeicola vulgatus]